VRDKWVAWTIVRSIMLLPPRACVLSRCWTPTEEDSGWGEANIIQPNPERCKDVLIKSTVDDRFRIEVIHPGSSGLTAAGTRENTSYTNTVGDPLFGGLADSEVLIVPGVPPSRRLARALTKHRTPAGFRRRERTLLRVA
jgi:hypothetical protein